MTHQKHRPAVSRRSLMSAVASAALLQACGGGAAPLQGAGNSGGGAGEGTSIAPRIVTEPADATVVAGVEVSFGVTATGDAPLAYQWLRDGARIPGATAATFALPSPAQSDHGARFSVVVANAAGTVTSRTATLTVLPGSAVTLLAGGLGGGGHLDGTGAAARFDLPIGIAVGPTGDIHVSAYNTIRRITPAGGVTTVAGLYGSPGHADGTGAAARFDEPTGMCFDAAGNLYVSDSSTQTIRKVTPDGRVTTVAGSGTRGAADGTGTAASFSGPWDLAADSAGNLFVADAANCTIRKITAAGVVTTHAGAPGSPGSADGPAATARFKVPRGLAIDDDDNLYVADSFNNRIRKITPAGLVSTLAGSGTPGAADGTGAAAEFSNPTGLTLSGATLYVADAGNHLVRAVSLAGAVTTLAGDGQRGADDGSGAAARFDVPLGVASDAAGTLYVTDSQNNTVRRIAGHAVTTFAGSASQAGSVDGTGGAARFSQPQSVAMDQAGNAYIADTTNHTIRKIAPDGATTTLAGAPGIAGAADGAGTAARFNGPCGVAVDAAGTVYVGDSNNHLVRKITPGGVVTTLAGKPGTAGSTDGNAAAARFNWPNRLSVDGTGVVYVADTLNHTIRRIAPDGTVTTVAGSPAQAGAVDGTGAGARFHQPRSVVVFGEDLFVADAFNSTIRRIASDGSVTTFAGQPGVDGAADGTGAGAAFNRPIDLSVDAAGNLYVADPRNCLIRKIDTAARVTTLFGQLGAQGVRTGPAPGAFASPVGVACNAAGTVLYVVDSSEHAALRLTVA